MFPHKLEATDIALKAVYGLESLKARVGEGTLLPRVLDFYAEYFQPSSLHIFLSMQGLLLQFFFKVASVLRRRECIF